MEEEMKRKIEVVMKYIHEHEPRRISKEEQEEGRRRKRDRSIEIKGRKI